MKLKSQNGFTLIELLVVIAIISVLSSVILSSLNSARSKSRDAKRALEVRQLKTALEYYYDANGFYPSIGGDNVGYALSGLSTPLATYIKTIPSDPSGSAVWQYVRGSVSTSSYGLLIYREKTAANCGTGVNFNSGWWGVGANICPF